MLVISDLGKDVVVSVTVGEVVCSTVIKGLCVVKYVVSVAGWLGSGPAVAVVDICDVLESVPDVLRVVDSVRVVCVTVSLLDVPCMAASVLVVSGMFVAELDAVCVISSGTSMSRSVVFCWGCCVELGLCL